MLRNRLIAAGLSLFIAAGLIAGCGSSKDTTKDQPKDNTNTQTEDNKGSTQSGSYKDGIYFAQEDKFAEKSGWKYVLTLEVKDGKIISADWNGAHKSGAADKKTQSKDGTYGMKAKGNSIAEWHEQAELVEKYLLEKQDPGAIVLKDDNTTDAISGATIKVKEFVDLAKKALASEPVGVGRYKDGAYKAEEADFNANSGWKSTINLTVINGYIVAVNWNAVHKDGGDNKKVQSADGRYGMVAKGGAIAEWHEQAALVEAYLIKTQDPEAIEYKAADGTTDAISGATIKVKSMFELAKEALKDAKR